jgi:hypothetical protein
MKLSLEQYSELCEMARHFGKIEEIAGQMGIEVDSLADGCNMNIYHIEPKRNLNLHALTSNRKHIFRNNIINGNTERSSIVNLAVIVNEDRF